MLGISRRRLVKTLDTKRIERAIEEAELKTSGEIRVCVAPLFWGSVERAARRAFERLGMTKTRERNGVLFFLVPARQSFVVLGDEGIHLHVGSDFWQAIVESMRPHFRGGRFTEGLLVGIALAGDRLAEHFPYDPEADRNELPNVVTT